MPHYIDGYVLPLSRNKTEEYHKLATAAGALWKEHGALQYTECLGEDFDVQDQVSFPTLAGAKADETVVFAFVVFESREHRDAVNTKVMADPRLREICDGKNTPFDFRRMAYGGFQAIVEL